MQKAKRAEAGRLESGRAKVISSKMVRGSQRVQFCKLNPDFDCAKRHSFKSFLRSLPNLSMYDKLIVHNMKVKTKKVQDELRPEYDFDYSKAVRGKYHKRLMAEGANIVMLEPDVARAFVDSAAVNDALRSLLDLTKTTQRLTKKSSGRGIATH